MRRLSLLVVLLLVGSLGDAEAQRRRRRRAEEPAQTEEPAETLPADAAPPTPAPDAAVSPPVEPQVPLAAPAEPEPEPESGAAAAPTETVPNAEMEAEAATSPDLSPLRADFATLMDELVQARSRIAVLGRQLFQTKLRVRVENRAGDQVLSSLALRLDAAPVFQADGDVGDDGRQVFEGFAAPGPHELGVELEQRARADDAYRYVQRDRFRFQVVQGKVTEVTIVLDDDSDIAEDFEDDGEGEYDVRIRVRVATRDLGSEN